MRRRRRSWLRFVRFVRFAGVLVASCGGDDTGPDADLIVILPADAGPGSGGDCTRALRTGDWVGIASGSALFAGAGGSTTASVTRGASPSVDR